MRQLAVALFCAVLAGGCGGDGGGSAPTPTATTSSTPQGLDLPQGGCCQGIGLGPGLYALPPWLVPLTIVDVPPLWRVVNDPTGQFLAFARGTNELLAGDRFLGLFVAPSGKTPAAVAAEIRAMPTIAVTGTPANATVGPYAGLRIEANARPNPNSAGRPAWLIPRGTQRLPALERMTKGYEVWTATPQARLRFHVFTVSGRTVVAYLAAPPADFAAFSKIAEDLLAKVR